MRGSILTLSILAAALTANAQESKVPTGADYLKAYQVADCTIPFDVNSEGKPFRVKWGMDSAWDWDYNVNRGIAHIGKGNFETGRVSFQPNDLVTDNGDGTYTLSAAQKKELDWRIKLIKSTGTTEANINCDHEALFVKDANGNIISRKGYENYCGKPEEWYKLIKASVQYCEKQGLKIISISPFNEPDFGWSQYNGKETDGMKDFLAIAKLLKEDPYFNGIRICGGNTLNCDRALPWYNYLKDNLDEGNTHQLAGEFKTYADFFATVKADGKIGTADELHNVGEAIVGANYGMENGIWWGFDAKARGQFCRDSNEGVRIGYGEDRSHWTSGAVYRNDATGEVHGYLGSSERQANTSTFDFVSQGRDVFFNGHGPARHWQFTLPGGKAGSYQNGQINAELLFDITWGEDVAPMEINGTYQIMNASSKKLITMTSAVGNVQTSSRKTSGTTQQWNVYPHIQFGDCSYWVFDNAGNTNAHFNLNNRNLNDNADLITYNAGHEDVEQWYIKYAKDGYYYIISRISNKYLYCSSSSNDTKITLKSLPDNATETTLKKYLWRFMPVDAKAETNAPAAPTELSVRKRPASIELMWTAPVDEDVANYIVLRSEEGTDEWNTIARQIEGTRYVDNNVAAGHSYIYKVKAVDLSGNRSDASEAVKAAPISDHSLICQLQFDNSLADNTDNHLDAAFYGTEKYNTSTIATGFKSGKAALQFDGKSYVIAPRSIADRDEMTIASWVRIGSTTSNWMRVFDFGSDTEHYMFFTPNNGSEMRFVMKNGGDEQILTNGKKLTTSTTSWKHVAITIRPLDGGNIEAVLYVDGEEIARKSDFTIKPIDINPSVCYIGRSMFKADPLFNGRLDDFRIYNYALNADEVKALLTDTEGIAADYRDVYEDVATEITAPAVAKSSKAMYDLNGRQLAQPVNGVVIKDGKKVIVK